MPELFRQEIDCPYCGESITAEAEPEAGNHHYIEDCPVCCRPIEFDTWTMPTGERRIRARRDDEC